MVVAVGICLASVPLRQHRHRGHVRPVAVLFAADNICSVVLAVPLLRVERASGNQIRQRRHTDRLTYKTDD